MKKPISIRVKEKDNRPCLQEEMTAMLGFLQNKKKNASKRFESAAVRRERF